MAEVPVESIAPRNSVLDCHWGFEYLLHRQLWCLNRWHGECTRHTISQDHHQNCFRVLFPWECFQRRFPLYTQIRLHFPYSFRISIAVRVQDKTQHCWPTHLEFGILSRSCHVLWFAQVIAGRTLLVDSIWPMNQSEIISSKFCLG